MIYFIVNPAAGNGKSKQAVPIIEQFTLKHGIKHIILYTKKPEEAKEMASQTVNSGADAIISVGGDGTVQEIATGMLSTNTNSGTVKNTALGILPAGSGNDLYCSVKGSTKLPGSFDRLIESSLSSLFPNGKIGKTEYFDAVKMGNEYFLNIGSIGLDAEIVIDAAGLKKRFGRLAYVVSTIKNSLTYSSESIRILADGMVIDKKSTLVAICNGMFYGGGFRITPSAKMNDGLITICHIESMPKFKVLLLFPAVFFGKHTGFKEVRYINCKSLLIEKKGEFSVNIDGNILNRAGRLDFSIMPNAIKIIK